MSGLVRFSTALIACHDLVLLLGLKRQARAHLPSPCRRARTTIIIIMIISSATPPRATSRPIRHVSRQDAREFTDHHGTNEQSGHRDRDQRHQANRGCIDRRPQAANQHGPAAGCRC